jgi:hypothetical protein
MIIDNYFNFKEELLIIRRQESTFWEKAGQVTLIALKALSYLTVIIPIACKLRALYLERNQENFQPRKAKPVISPPAGPTPPPAGPTPPPAGPTPPPAGPTPPQVDRTLRQGDPIPPQGEQPLPQGVFLTKEAVIEAIDKNVFDFNQLSDEQKVDADIAIAAIRLESFNLRYFKNPLVSDRRFLLNALEINIGVLESLKHTEGAYLLKDLGFILEACKIDDLAYRFAHRNLWTQENYNRAIEIAPGIAQDLLLRRRSY